MDCPKCGNTLRVSKKDSSYGLCDNCRKKFKLSDEPDHNEYGRDDNSQRYSNLPPMHVRNAQEKKVKSGYAEMLSAGSDIKKSRRSRVVTTILVLITIFVIAVASIFVFWANKPTKNNTPNGNKTAVSSMSHRVYFIV